MTCPAAQKKNTAHTYRLTLLGGRGGMGLLYIIIRIKIIKKKKKFSTIAYHWKFLLLKKQLANHSCATAHNLMYCTGDANRGGLFCVSGHRPRTVDVEIKLFFQAYILARSRSLKILLSTNKFSNFEY